MKHCPIVILFYLKFKNQYTWPNKIGFLLVLTKIEDSFKEIDNSMNAENITTTYNRKLTDIVSELCPVQTVNAMHRTGQPWFTELLSDLKRI